ncbi:MAG: pyridoxamine 5'-phosphate oxidase family protein [Cyanobacteria bacterium SBLK]|nr:pyridoxamine 5'-phosphate oxidase family protein [Cyanobacteria bacterium SBLK]
MSFSPWRSHLETALDRNHHLPFSRYFQLATITPMGYPANRTVVFRGFFQDSDRLKIITDSRCEKLEQIQHCQWGEICWYFSETREQFRLLGQLIIVDETESDLLLKQEWRSTWQSLSEATRIQFTWPPSKEKRQYNSSSLFSSSPRDRESLSEPLENFNLLLLEPKKVDYLRLRGNPQNRYLYVLNSSSIWEEMEVNP